MNPDQKLLITSQLENLLTDIQYTKDHLKRMVKIEKYEKAGKILERLKREEDFLVSFYLDTNESMKRVFIAYNRLGYSRKDARRDYICRRKEDGMESRI